MRQITRFAALAVLALPVAGVIGSAFASGATGSPSGSATATTMKATTTTTPTSVCSTPVVTHLTPPAVGGTLVVPAGTAGTVTLKRTSTTNLLVVSVKPATGWTDTITAASGTKVRVHFRMVKPTGEVDSVRFIAHMNATNTKLDVRTVSCKTTP